MGKMFDIENMRIQSATLWAVIVVAIGATLAYADIRSQLKELQSKAAERFTISDYGYVVLLHNQSPDRVLPKLDEVRSLQKQN